MDILSFILTLILFFSILLLLLAIGLAYVAYRLSKSNPALAILVFIVILVLGGVQFASIEGIVTGIMTWAAGLIALIASYKNLKTAFK